MVNVTVTVLQLSFAMCQKFKILKFHPKEYTMTHTHCPFVQPTVRKWDRIPDTVPVISLEIKAYEVYSVL
jgi:hypothetical protein